RDREQHHTQQYKHGMRHQLFGSFRKSNALDTASTLNSPAIISSVVPYSCSLPSRKDPEYLTTSCDNRKGAPANAFDHAPAWKIHAVALSKPANSPDCTHDVPPPSASPTATAVQTTTANIPAWR